MTEERCRHCGDAFTEANPSDTMGYCEDAWACVHKKWEKEEGEKKHDEPDEPDEPVSD